MTRTACPNGCGASFRPHGGGLAFHLTHCKPAEPTAEHRAFGIAEPAPVIVAMPAGNMYMPGDYVPGDEPVIDATGHDYRPAERGGIRPCPACATLTDTHGASRHGGGILAPAEYAAELARIAEPTAEPGPTVSAGHIGWSWTIEGGVVEVLAVGASIVRAPISNVISTSGHRLGREWWPAGVQFEAMWRADTFADMADARDAYTAYTAERATPAMQSAPVQDPAVIAEHWAEFHPGETPEPVAEPIAETIAEPIAETGGNGHMTIGGTPAPARKAPARKAPAVGTGKHGRCVAHVPMTRADGVAGVAYACFDTAPDAAAIADRRAFVADIDASILAHHAAELERPAPDGLVSATTHDGAEHARVPGSTYWHANGTGAGLTVADMAASRFVGISAELRAAGRATAEPVRSWSIAEPSRTEPDPAPSPAAASVDAFLAEHPMHDHAAALGSAHGAAVLTARDERAAVADAERIARAATIDASLADGSAVDELGIRYVGLTQAEYSAARMAVLYPAEPIASAPDAMTRCNACEIRPMVLDGSDNGAGYCAECLADAQPAPAPRGAPGLTPSVYRLTAYASHADREAGRVDVDVLYTGRDAAMRARDGLEHPIADVVAEPVPSGPFAAVQYAEPAGPMAPAAVMPCPYTVGSAESGTRCVGGPAGHSGPHSWPRGTARPGRGRRQCPVHGRAGLAACDLCGDPWTAEPRRTVVDYSAPMPAGFRLEVPGVSGAVLAESGPAEPVRVEMSPSLRASLAFAAGLDSGRRPYRCARTHRAA